MASTRGALQMIKDLRGMLTEVFAEDVDGLCDELGSLHLITSSEYKEVLCMVDGAVAKAKKLIDVVQQKGQPACQTFLDHLENMISRFPPLASLMTFNKRKDSLYKMMNRHKDSKIMLKNVLGIGMEHLTSNDPQTIEDIPKHFLMKIMALDKSARNTRVSHDNGNEEEEPDALCPLDVLCAVLYCSDAFLQQEIISKMSMCQFAVPLLLPPPDGGSPCTFMLWTLRDIVKQWRPQSLPNSKGFKEETLVKVSMPIYTFVRLGRCSVSKSKIVNSVLSTAQQNNDFFVHRDMDCGYIDREISEGLVEFACYFPCGRQEHGSFPEPFGVTNLRGDIKTHGLQFHFLTQISSVVFIFIENVCEEISLEYTSSHPEYYFIISDAKHEDPEKFLKTLFPRLSIHRKNIITKRSFYNDAMLVSKIKKIITMPCYYSNLEEVAEKASEFGIMVDENSQGCWLAKTKAQKITNEITEVAEYKRKAMTLQGDLWKQLTLVEKELCKRKQQGNEDQEKYKTQLVQKRSILREKQHKENVSHGMLKFISAITHLSRTDKQFFLKWMKFQLDAITRVTLSALQAKYEELLNNQSPVGHSELKQVDQKLCDSALGAEHFMRELGQLYEAEFHVLKNGKMMDTPGKFAKLPGIAAGLLLDGLPLELIDGDASNIPLQWIHDVLMEVDNMTGGQCRMRVITVLGVQSTGKSTLLNTMFGLQFPVASGRCTRGAFMTLLKVNENFQEQLGCHFIMVIDTEGLRCPQLASLEESYEHDNELATFVIGLSDITIVNISMENTAVMKDILQIVVHAFLRMKDIKRKPNCQFIHQNVGDVSAYSMNMRDRKKFLDLLNEITELAAKLEKKGKISFNDIMVYDLNEHTWYIPGLWQGVPPMASISPGYTEVASELKKYLLDYMTKITFDHRPRSMWEFLEWIKTLWNAVKYENFIFSFRNSLVAEAYNKLCIIYTQWDWSFRKQVHTWLTGTETTVRNMSDLASDLYYTLMKDLEDILQREEETIKQLLEDYFNSKSENVHLLEKYRENFLLDIRHLKTELANYATNKLSEALRIKKGKDKIQIIKDNYQSTMEDKVSSLLAKCRRQKSNLVSEELKQEFDAMWKASSLELSNLALAKRNVNHELMQQLKQDMSYKGGFINEKLLNVRSLADYKGDDFNIEEKHFEFWDTDKAPNEILKHDFNNTIGDLVISIIDQCKEYVETKINTNEDFDETYSRELLNIINTRINVAGLKTTASFELDVKLKVMGNSLQGFQMMHDTYLQENDPVLCLEKLKPNYFSVFENIFQQKDESQHRAKEFCELGLKPALKEHIDRHLGERIMDDFLRSDSKIYGSRRIFQYKVLKKLLLDKDVGQYLKYINSYKRFVKKWIWQDLEAKYGGSEMLQGFQLTILSSVIEKVKSVLREPACPEDTAVSDFVANICTKLQEDLVIPHDVTRLVLFQNKINIAEFTGDIGIFLADTVEQLEGEIKSTSFDAVLSRVTLKPQDELYRKVIGCGRQCPFCGVPCEVEGVDHKEHLSSVHRPKGLSKCTWKTDGRLVTSTCSQDVNSEKEFMNGHTKGKLHPYSDYRAIYPDWSIEANDKESDYWIFVFRTFNRKFADAYVVEEAQLSNEWMDITEEDALRSLRLDYNVNEESNSNAESVLEEP